MPKPDTRIEVFLATPGDVLAERTIVFEEIAPHLDALFDQGFITVADVGTVVISTALDPDARKLLGITDPNSWRAPITGHRGYLQWHRERVFNKWSQNC